MKNIFEIPFARPRIDLRSIMDDQQHMYPEDHPGVTCTFEENQPYKVAGRSRESDMYFREFVNFTEFVDYVDRDRPKDKGRALDESRNRELEDFHEHDNWTKAMNFAKGGWDSGRQQVLDVLDDIEIGDADFHGETMTENRQVYGERLDMGAYLAGDPQCYRQREFVEDERSSGHAGITLNVSVCYSSGVNQEEITARGAVAAALAEALDYHGIAVEINAIAAFGGKTGSGPKQSVCYKVPIKKGQEPLNPDTLAFQLANPDMLRRLIFSAVERDQPEIRDSLGRGYGKVADLEQHNEDHEIYLSGGDVRKTDWQDEHTRTEWIRQELEEQGITLDR